MAVAAGAMAFVANTQGLIFDIRGHKGGAPEIVQLLISYLVGEEPQPLTGIYSRASGQTEAYTTLKEIPGKRITDIPVYIVVDSQTHSAAEAFTYDLQALKRATIIGTRTRGGAHLLEFISLKSMFVLMLPVSRVINPITNGNWQGTGVIPNIENSSDEVLQIADRKVLDVMLASAKDSEERTFLQNEMKLLTIS